MNKSMLALITSFAALVAACGSDTGADELSGGAGDIVGGVPATGYPEGALLKANIRGKADYVNSMCSAALIAPQVVLTAGHCVDGNVRWEVTVGKEVRSSVLAETFDWKENGAQSVNPNHHDIGLVYLSDPIVLASYPTLAESAVANGTAALNVGRIHNGQVSQSLYQAPVSLADASGFGFPFDYTSTSVIQPGDSGGPVFVSGTHTIVAVNSGSDTRTQVLARVDLLNDWIQQRIVSHGGAGPSSSAPPSNPAPPASTPPPAPSSSGAPSSSSPPPPPPPPPTCTPDRVWQRYVCGVNNVNGYFDWYYDTKCGTGSSFTRDTSKDCSKCNIGCAPSCVPNPVWAAYTCSHAGVAGYWNVYVDNACNTPMTFARNSQWDCSYCGVGCP